MCKYEYVYVYTVIYFVVNAKHFHENALKIVRCLFRCQHLEDLASYGQRFYIRRPLTC